MENELKKKKKKKKKKNKKKKKKKKKKKLSIINLHVTSINILKLLTRIIVSVNNQIIKK